MRRISLIVAVGEHNGVIGHNNDLPWKLARPNADMERFVTLTAGHPVIMGRKTMDSIPSRFFPLDKERTSIVVTRSLELSGQGFFVARDIDTAIELARGSPGSEEIFIAGGAEIYALALPYADRIYKTLVNVDVEGDTFFPRDREFSRIIESDVVLDYEPRLTFLTLERA